ncbi:hypothetical protein BH09PSE2_BH09PSE2_09410 [soil metagenome]
MIKTLMISTAALLLVSPAVANAQSYGWYQHQQDHAEHGSFHEGAEDAHEEAHERGFYSQAEHDGYHEALRDVHDGFHDDHPGTRHDGYRVPARRQTYYDYPSYQPSYGYSGYGYSPYSYSPYGGSVSFVFGR